MATENKEIVSRFINKYQTDGREEIADELLADDFVDHSALPGFTPDKEGVKNLFKMLRGAFGGFRAMERGHPARTKKEKNYVICS